MAEEDWEGWKMLTDALGGKIQLVGDDLFVTLSLIHIYNVMNRQREIIYSQREEVLSGAELKPKILQMINDYIDSVINSIAEGDQSLSHEKTREIVKRFTGLFLFPGESFMTPSDKPAGTTAEFAELMKKRALEVYEKKEQELTAPVMRELERVVLLKTVDRHWTVSYTHLDVYKRQPLRAASGRPFARFGTYLW